MCTPCGQRWEILYRLFRHSLKSHFLSESNSEGWHWSAESAGPRLTWSARTSYLCLAYRRETRPPCVGRPWVIERRDKSLSTVEFIAFFQGTIADYTPMIPPMVPSLVVHCINEVELRGMGEQGLYRVNGGTSEVKCLKEKFLKGKGAPNLSDVDIPTICSTLKDFLRTLREPLITVGLWGDFARAATIQDKQDADAALYQAISELPQPNRDTLAFLILHLQRVSSSPECKMPITNLAKVFGPTLVGYSCQEPSPKSMLTETKSQVAVRYLCQIYFHRLRGIIVRFSFQIVENLLEIPSDYWANFVNSEGLNGVGTPKTGELRHTPSTESLLKRTTSRGFFNTPISSRYKKLSCIIRIMLF